jgi:hypothetical protein
MTSPISSPGSGIECFVAVCEYLTVESPMPLSNVSSTTILEGTILSTPESRELYKYPMS